MDVDNDGRKDDDTDPFQFLKHECFLFGGTVCVVGVSERGVTLVGIFNRLPT